MAAGAEIKEGHASEEARNRGTPGNDPRAVAPDAMLSGVGKTAGTQAAASVVRLRFTLLE